MATPPGFTDIELNARDLARAGIHSPEQAQRRLDRITRQWERREQLQRAFTDPDIILSDRDTQLKVICGISLREQELSDALQNYCSLMALAIAGGKTVTYDDTHRDINQIAEAQGFLSGVPVPILGEDSPDLVMAPGVPLAEIFHMNQAARHLDRTEAEGELRLGRMKVRNSWRVLGDHTVCVIDTTEGPMSLRRWDAGIRLRKMAYGMEVRHKAHQRAEAELKAMDSLKARISRSQYDSYVLSGVFPEHSPRSDLYYYFRKGLPTLAISFHGGNSDSGKVLAALCLHPMGYYQGTHVGLMTPTDEVIAHLLMMRSDEHRFWAKSGQWSASDTRSGV